MPIQEWTIDEEGKSTALQLQAWIREAGLNWPQLDALLELRRGTVCEWCRAHEPLPRGMLERIKEILDKVKTGKIKPPIVNAEVL